MNDFFEQVRKAKNEAVKREIKANAILISDKLYFSKCSKMGLICGLKPFYTNELPDDTLFAVVNADVFTESFRIWRKIMSEQVKSILKPCPFCGADREYIVAEEYEHGAGKRWRVFCLSCMATMDKEYCQTQWQALEAWNRRAERRG